MKCRAWQLVLVLAAAAIAPTAIQQLVAAQNGAPAIDTGAYTVVANWLQPVTPGTAETGYGVAVDNPNRIFIAAGNEFTPPKPGSKPEEGAVAGGGGGRAANAPPPPHHYIRVV